MTAINFAEAQRLVVDLAGACQCSTGCAGGPRQQCKLEIARRHMAGTPTWTPATTPPAPGRYLVAIAGACYEARYMPDADSALLLLDGWLLADTTEHRRMMRTGASVTHWAELPNVA